MRIIKSFWTFLVGNAFNTALAILQTVLALRSEVQIWKQEHISDVVIPASPKLPASFFSGLISFSMLIMFLLIFFVAHMNPLSNKKGTARYKTAPGIRFLKFLVSAGITAAVAGFIIDVVNDGVNWSNYYIWFAVPVVGYFMWEYIVIRKKRKTVWLLQRSLKSDKEEQP